MIDRDLGGYWVEALWFPEWKLEAWASPDEWTGDVGGPARLNVTASDWPHANTEAGPAVALASDDPRTPYQGRTERVEVPWELAQRIRAAGAVRAQYETERMAGGPALASTGLLRKVPRDFTTFRGK
jgi:hypothetical protein